MDLSLYLSLNSLSKVAPKVSKLYCEDYNKNVVILKVKVQNAKAVKRENSLFINKLVGNNDPPFRLSRFHRGESQSCSLRAPYGVSAVVARFLIPMSALGL